MFVVWENKDTLFLFRKLRLEKLLGKERENFERKHKAIMGMEKELKAIGNEIKIESKQVLPRKSNRVMSSSYSEDEPAKKKKLDPPERIDLTIDDDSDISISVHHTHTSAWVGKK